MKRLDVSLRNKSKSQRDAVSRSHADGRHKKAYERISVSMKGNQNGLGSKHPHTDETKKIIRESTTTYCGNEHWNWKGGISRTRPETREYKEWKREILKRDNYTCQCCGVKGGLLHPHHIKRWVDFPDLRYNYDNGITLCVRCHRSVYKISFQLGFQLP